VLIYQITFLPVISSAGLMLRPVRKMPNYFPETRHSTVSFYNVKLNQWGVINACFVSLEIARPGAIKQYTKQLYPERGHLLDVKHILNSNTLFIYL
jgi:hypothetical protein